MKQSDITEFFLESTSSLYLLLCNAFHSNKKLIVHHITTYLFFSFSFPEIYELLSISNKSLGPLRVRDKESPLYMYSKLSADSQNISSKSLCVVIHHKPPPPYVVSSTSFDMMNATKFLQLDNYSTSPKGYLTQLIRLQSLFELTSHGGYPTELVSRHSQNITEVKQRISSVNQDCRHLSEILDIRKGNSVYIL